MGTLTEEAPAAVRVGELRTALRCSRESQQLMLELEGPGEAILLASLVGSLPITASADEWERRATNARQLLPEVRPDSTRSLAALGLYGSRL